MANSSAKARTKANVIYFQNWYLRIGIVWGLYLLWRVLYQGFIRGNPLLTFRQITWELLFFAIAETIPFKMMYDLRVSRGDRADVEYYFDALCVVLASQVLTTFFGSGGMYLNLVIPLFVLYKGASWMGLFSILKGSTDPNAPMENEEIDESKLSKKERSRLRIARKRQERKDRKRGIVRN